MNTRGFWILCLCIFGLQLSVFARDSCSDINADGKHFDLTSLMGITLEATTRVAAQTMSVDFAICGNLQAPCQYTQGSSPRCASPNTAAACQSWGSSRQKDQACLGNFNGTVGAIPIIEGNEVKGVTLTYYGGDICSTCTGVFDRYTFINIYCDKTVAGRPSNIQYGVIQPPSSKSTITFSHSAGCMTYSGGGLSPGSALLIIFFVLLIVYIVGGVVINKFVRHQHGARDIFPNSGFWLEIPSLVGDGFRFLIAKCRGQPMQGSYEQVPSM